MDFSFTEEQQAIQSLAEQIFEGRVSHDRLKEIEATEDRFDRPLWAELARSNLLGIAVPEELGGSGLGFIELCLVLEQAGRRLPAVPLLATLVMGALPITVFGSDSQRRACLPPVVSGDLVLSAALVEVGTDSRKPATTASPDGPSWRLDGVKVCVPAGLLAERILVPARVLAGEREGEGGSVGVFIVDPSSAGVALESQDTTTGYPEARLELSGALVGPGDVLGDVHDGSRVVEWMVQHTTVGLCALAVGVCEEALRLTAEYTKTREQFDRPIATFQAVGQRAADAYIDTEAIRLTTLQAMWRLAESLPADQEVAVAKFWAAEGGQRVVHAAQHLHGGIGVDRDYPLHRYFLLAKQIELTLGGATPQLLRIGALLAADPV